MALDYTHTLLAILGPVNLNAVCYETSYITILPSLMDPQNDDPETPFSKSTFKEKEVPNSEQNFYVQSAGEQGQEP